MATKTLEQACEKAFDGLTREYPWMGGAVIVREDDGYFEAIPGAHLTDISYTGSRDVVTRWDSINDIVVEGDVTDYQKSEVVEWMMNGLE